MCIEIKHQIELLRLNFQNLSFSVLSFGMPWKRNAHQQSLLETEMEANDAQNVHIILPRKHRISPDALFLQLLRRTNPMTSNALYVPTSSFFQHRRAV
jgi:hypothetical protein